ncbi:MAG: hypothetical protein WBA74_10270 [Cyclobacteriaceae bacterium]
MQNKIEQSKKEEIRLKMLGLFNGDKIAKNINPNGKYYNLSEIVEEVKNNG